MTDEIEKLRRLDNQRLIDVVKNYRQYGYNEELRADAISILQERGITIEQLQLTGNFENIKYDRAHEKFDNFCKNSRITFVLYGILLITNILIPVFSLELETWENITIAVNTLAVVLYMVYLVKTFVNQSQFYEIIGKDYWTQGALLYFALGMPFYMFMYFFFRNQMDEQMKQIT